MDKRLIIPGALGIVFLVYDIWLIIDGQFNPVVIIGLGAWLALLFYLVRRFSSPSGGNPTKGRQRFERESPTSGAQQRMMRPDHLRA